MAPRILIVGAGAIGGVTAARLARSGVDVTVLDANPEHVALMRDPGLVFDELGTEHVVPLDAYCTAGDLPGRFDYALVILKAPFIEAALGPLVDHDLVDTYVSFGNGLVQPRVEAVVGRQRLIVGVVEWGATNLGPGRVAQTTIAPFVIGELDGRSSDRLLDLAGAMVVAGDVRVSDNVLGQVWAKLLLNTTFSGLGAVSGLVYSDVVAQPGGVDLALALWTEGYDVATAAGIELDEVAGVHPARLVRRAGDDPTESAVALAELMELLGPTKASMLQDLERGARTEIDVINGGLVSEAYRVGIAPPLNEGIVEIVHACERGDRVPAPQNLLDLAALLG